MRNIILSLLFSVLMLLPAGAFAGHIFHYDVTSDKNTMKMTYWVEGQKKKMDINMEGTTSISVISTPERKKPLYVMHDSETYMTDMPGQNMNYEIPEMKFEMPKKRVNPAEEVVKGMDTAETVKDRMRDYKDAPWDATYDTMTDLSAAGAEIEARQMMKKKMQEMQKIQKKMRKQAKQQQKMMKKRMENQKKRKNSISIKDFSFKPSAKTKKIGKYKTKLIQVYYKGTLFQNSWVTKDIDKSARNAYVSIAADHKMIGKGLEQYSKTMIALNNKILAYGFPVKIVSFHNQKTRILSKDMNETSAAKQIEIKLTKLEKKKISGKEFKPPKGYEEFKSVM